MDKYKRVDKPRSEEQATQVDPNEIRITQQGKVRSYISYANGLFAEKNERRVVLKAMGNAISKAVTVAEILKHRVANLHQVTRISSIETVDVYEPLEEGLDRIETTRHISSISIQLSLDEMERDDPGYQSPIPLDQVTAGSPTHFSGREFRKSKSHSRRSSRNGREPAATVEKKAIEETEADQQTPGEDEASGTNVPTSRAKRGKGRGRGRNGHNGARGSKAPEQTLGEEGDDHAEARDAVEQQVEGESKNSVTNRKAGRGKKGKKFEKTSDEKETEKKEGFENNNQASKGRHNGRGRGRFRGRDRGGREVSNGRDENAASSASAGTKSFAVTEA